MTPLDGVFFNTFVYYVIILIEVIYLKNKISLFLKIILIIWTIGVLYFFVTKFNFDIFIINGKEYSLTPIETTVTTFMIGVFLVLFSFLMPPFNLIIIYLIYSRNVKNKIKENVKFEKHNLEYCREHLNDLSPDLVSFLKNFSIELKKDISAHILKLLYQGYLAIENERLIISNKSKEDLYETDLFILNLIGNEKITEIDITKYEKLVEKEALKAGLITYKSREWKKVIIKFVVSLFAIILLLNILPTFFVMGYGNMRFEMFFIFVFVIFIIFIFILQLSFLANIIALSKTKTLIIRTSKGKKILKNIYSLEKFLKDFGALDKSSYKEVYTREYFLIYSVTLNINKKIINELSEMCQFLK